MFVCLIGCLAGCLVRFFVRCFGVSVFRCFGVWFGGLVFGLVLDAVGVGVYWWFFFGARGWLLFD